MSITEDGVGNSVIALDWRADLIESWAIEAGNLVLVSGFDSNDWDVRKVTVNNVYGDTAYPRSLQNSKLTFITKDGFHWVPDLPDSIEHDNWLAIEAVMVQQGTPQNPAILNDKSEQSIAHDKDTSYYVSRLIELTTLNIKQKSEYSTTLHLDYAPRIDTDRGPLQRPCHSGRRIGHGEVWSVWPDAVLWQSPGHRE
ncbi:hypothetical protein QZH47_29655 [Pseudomonas corrugata]